MQQPEDRRRDDARLNISAGAAAVTVAAVLVGIKLWALRETASLTVAASLADSAIDLVASLGGLLAIFYASRPPDDDHAFGHTSAEDLAALAQSILITISAGLIIWRAVERLLDAGPAPLASETQGMAAMLLSILLTGALVLWQRRVASRTGSRVVAADSLHYLSDLLPNIGAIVALGASAAFGVGKVDSVIALISAAILLAGARGIARGAFNALMDRRADMETVRRIERIAAEHPGVRGFHDLKTRTAGAKLFVQIHIELDGDQTLREAHDIGAALRRRIMTDVPNAEVIVHKDVAGDREDGDAGSF